MKSIIRVENLSKRYIIGGKQEPYSTFRESVVNALKVPLNALRPSTQNNVNSFWALKDVNFEIMPGQVVGIIGRNGAGKSTLLKILSRITEPTKGRIELYGRVGSLLEVGTGFHLELTGRENIYLNGAILGMKREEINKKFDEIVDFAEIGDFLDTPVKRYSSGMYMRLAFAVAANLEPEILIVDEVLAVGDAEFQKKCLGKMKDVSEHGRTVLFVSHNMNAISQLCSHGILMRKGQVEFQGATVSAIEKYINSGAAVSSYSADESDDKPTQILDASILNRVGEPTVSFRQDEDIYLKFRIKNFSNERGLVCAVCVYDLTDKILTVDCVDIAPVCGYQTFQIKIPKRVLVPNKLKFSISLFVPDVKTIEIIPELLSFEILGTDDDYLKYGNIETGVVRSNMQWSVIES